MNKSVRATIIFLLFGVLLFVISYLLQVLQANAFLSSAFFNAAFVILTVVILNVLWALLGGEPVANAIEKLTGSLQQSFQIIKESSATGVVGLSVSGKFSPDAWAERLRNSRQQVDLMGYTLITWINTPHFENNVLKLVQKGVKIRILILDETNPHFDSFINSHLAGTSKDSTRSELKVAREAFENIRQKVQMSKTANSSGDFELRTAREGVITCNICRTDDNMIVVSYMYWQQVATSPLLLILQSQEESNLFQAYQEEFDHLWEYNA